MATIHQLRNTSLTDDENAVLAAAEAILLRRINTGPALASPEAAGEMLRLRLAHHTREVFTAVFLDTHLRVLAVEDLFLGTIDGCEIHPRAVIVQALAHNAASVIVAHNHPSGDGEPSAADRAVTMRLKESLRLVDIRLLDHFVVVPGSKPVSLASRGWV